MESFEELEQLDKAELIGMIFCLQGLVIAAGRKMADYAALEQRCEELALETLEPSIKELDVLWRIRKAVGDNGKMMQDDLVTHIADISKKVGRLQAENALLRKRLKPIEALWDKGDDYVIANIDDVRTALLACMDLEEGVK